MLHVDDKEQRKLVLAAVKKAGYKNGASGPGSATIVEDPAAAVSSIAAKLAAKSQPSTSNTVRVMHKLVLNVLMSFSLQLEEGLPKETQA